MLFLILRQYLFHTLMELGSRRSLLVYDPPLSKCGHWGDCVMMLRHQCGIKVSKSDILTVKVKGRLRVMIIHTRHTC